jgi:DNA-binding GntR family transcriptional regulator
MLFMLEALAALYDSALVFILHVSDRPSFPRPLGAQEEAAAVQAMLSGDEGAAQKLIRHNLRWWRTSPRSTSARGLSRRIWCPSAPSG